MNHMADAHPKTFWRFVETYTEQIFERLLDKAIVHLGNINRFLDDDQGHWSQVWTVGVPKDKAVPGEFYEPVGVPTKSYTPYCLDENLAAKLWDWTEEELKSYLSG